MSLARAYERRHQEAVQTTLPATLASPWPKPTSSSGSTTGAALGLALPLAVKPYSALRPRFRRLSSEEMAGKRGYDECYFCTETFGPDHKCLSKGIFLLELKVAWT